MSVNPTLLARFRKADEELEIARVELKSHPEVLDELRKEVSEFDKKIETMKGGLDKEIEAFNKKIGVTKKELEDLYIMRKKSVEIISRITGAKLVGEKAGRAPSGEKAKSAVEYLHTLGIGGKVTPTDLTEHAGMMKGYPGTWLRKLMVDGYLTQGSPREPYVIVKLPEL